jgi:hypothetical protein
MADEKYLQNQENRRKHERVARDNTIRYSHLLDLTKELTEKTAPLLDIGGGGLRFQTEELLEKNTQLVIIVEFPGWETDENNWLSSNNSTDIGVLKVIGIVMWSVPSENDPEQYEVGVRFSGRIT